MTRWLAQQTADGAHVLPLDGLIDHCESDECVCGPTVELVQDDRGSGWLTTHHSLDGREQHEEAVVTRQPHTVLDYLTEWGTRGGVQVGDGLVMPVQPPVGSRVRVNGGKYTGMDFELTDRDEWVCRYLDMTFAEGWAALLGSARSGGVTVLRVGPQ